MMILNSRKLATILRLEILLKAALMIKNLENKQSNSFTTLFGMPKNETKDILSLLFVISFFLIIENTFRLINSYKLSDK